MTPDAELLRGFCEVRAEALDLTFRSLDHGFEVGDQFLVYRVVGGLERIEGGCAGAVENPEHREVFVSVSRHERLRARRCGVLNLVESWLGFHRRCVVLTSEAPGLSPRENRIRRNEELFREVNARIAELEDRISLPGELLPLICECANTGCTTLIEVEPETFAAVRTNPRRFLMAPGHERAEEALVGSGAGYVIVEKEDGG